MRYAWPRFTVSWRLAYYFFQRFSPHGLSRPSPRPLRVLSEEVRRAPAARSASFRSAVFLTPTELSLCPTNAQHEHSLSDFRRQGGRARRASWCKSSGTYFRSARRCSFTSRMPPPPGCMAAATNGAAVGCCWWARRMSYEVGGEGWVVGQGLGRRACFRAHRTHDCSCRNVPNVLCDVPCRLRIAVHEVLFDA